MIGDKAFRQIERELIRREELKDGDRLTPYERAINEIHRLQILIANMEEGTR